MGSPLTEGVVCIYLDDILIYTKTLKEHQQIMHIVLEHLCQHQLPQTQEV